MTSPLRCALTVFLWVGFANVGAAQSLVSAEHEFTVFDTSQIFPPGTEEILAADAADTKWLKLDLLTQPMRDTLMRNVLRSGRLALGDDSVEITGLEFADGMGGDSDSWHYDGGNSFRTMGSRLATLVAPIGPTATGVRFLLVSAEEADTFLREFRNPGDAMRELSQKPNRLHRARKGKASIHRRLTPHAHGQGLRLRAWFGHLR